VGVAVTDQCLKGSLQFGIVESGIVATNDSDQFADAEAAAH